MMQILRDICSYGVANEPPTPSRQWCSSRPRKHHLVNDLVVFGALVGLDGLAKF